MNIKEYKNAVKKLDELHQVKEKKQDEIHDKLSKVRDRYYELIRALQKRQSGEEKKLHEEREQFEDKILDQKKPLVETINEVERFFYFINIHANGRDNYFEVYHFNGGCHPNEQYRKNHVDPIDVIVDDEYKTIRAYILENRKPKNKFSLVIYGHSLFANSRYDNPFGLPVMSQYIDTIAHESGANIRYHVKDMPEYDQLLDYYEKRKATILKDYLTTHAYLENEFELAIDLFNKSREWQLTYWQWKRDYIKKNWSRGKESEEYKEIERKINELKNSDNKKQLAIKL